MTDTFWRDRTVMILGIGGFLGSRLARVLTDAGASVWGLDRYGPLPGLKAWGLPETHVRRGDLTQPGVVAAALFDARAEVVFHLAGASHINASQASPLPALEVNVRGAYLTLEACRERGGIRAVVVSSSNHIYGSLRTRGRSLHAPWHELDFLDAEDVYGGAMACRDHLTRVYGRTLGVPTVALRHCNGFGEGDIHPSHLVTAAVLRLLNGEAPIIKGNPQTLKNYTHVDNIIAAYVRCAELVANGLAPGQAFNAAPEKPQSVLEIIQAVIRVSGVAVEPIIEHSDHSQDGYVEHLDSRRFRALGWTETVGLEQGLARTLAWYREHPDFGQAAA